jgi:signal transduction histidine kinase
MTANFYSIKTELDGQVRLRTKEIVRKEQLASVGFLAAGVSHEINNPLAAIAWSAESLEMRLHDILNPHDQRSAAEIEAEIEDLKKYLRRIQNEAFRCKEITAGLLDFARLGDARKSPTDIGPLLEGVVEMVRPLSKYRDRKIELHCVPNLIAHVNPQEIKQVVLNLLTNALDSLSPGGTVSIRGTRDSQRLRLVFEDNGCGMTEEVQQHLFEPFFTRRRDGQGTGLGLSITYRIIEEHGGTIRPYSEGVGCGSRFTVEMPLHAHESKHARAA